MNCKKCGNILTEGETICHICGEPVNSVGTINPVPVPPQQPPQVAPQPVEQPTQVTPQPVEQQYQPTPGVTPSQQPMPTPESMVNQMPAQPQIMPNANQPQPMNPNMNIDMNNGMNSLNTPQPPKKNNTLLIIIIVILVIAILGVGGFVAYKVFNNISTNETSKSDKKETSTKEEKDDKDDDDDKKEVANEDRVYESNGFKFEIPSDVLYEVDDEVLTISDNKTYVLEMGVDYDIYEMYTADLSKTKAIFENNGFTVLGTEIIKESNMEFLIVAVSIEDQSGIYYVTKLSDNYIAYGLMMATTEDGYDKTLEILIDILSTKTQTSSFAQENNTEEEHTLPILDMTNKELIGIEYKLN